MKKLLALIVAIYSCQISLAQYGPKSAISISGAQYYNELVDMGYDSNGNIYLLGHKENTNQDIVLVKCTDSGCSLIATYNKSEPVTAYKLQVDDAGNSYIVGDIFDDGSNTQTDAIAIKYNSSGTLQWDDRYDSYGSTSSSDAYSFYDAVLDGTTLYVTGLDYGGLAGQDNMAIAKYTSNGTRTVKNYDNSNGHTVGHKLNIVGSTIYIGALDELNDNLEYYSIATNFTSSTSPTLKRTISSTWTNIDGMILNTDATKAAFMSDLGSSTQVQEIGTLVRSYTDSDMTNPRAMIFDGDDVIVAGDELDSEYRLAISGYRNGVRLFHSQLEPTPSSNTHSGRSSYAKGLFIDNNGNYGVPGKLTLDTDPNDGNSTLSSYAGVVSFDDTGAQIGFSVYETASTVSQGILNTNTGDVVLAGTKVWTKIFT